ncbi:hypothetical protein MCOR02_010235 [Pyricularia oryzae]|uniref:Uncharacterized protein n=1 Tax=Pyricularia oryzae TaxID=318829 RepID=A0A4P7NP04_PYROR|nr:hypothetical protein MCOR02_010235 [Pyricularia oryzae]KAI6291171.1 hypothetical protein MCOR34_010257 [Pyricularia oryzae]KAI6454549.1 hypothetical protein MCOR17_008999 [Pyricularia oryzae]KAI6481658.1 hypothetical protein MCOR13_010756 [Pyricularia oryzae]KAI6571501.1 hypothetical protein MCOR04_007823 [Pyricularia oryzae]
MSFNTQSSTSTNSTGQQPGPQSSYWRAEKPSYSPYQAGDAFVNPLMLSSPQHKTSEPSPDFASLLASAAAAAQAQLATTDNIDIDIDGHTSSDDNMSDVGGDESTGATAMPDTIDELATYSDDVVGAHAGLLPYLAGRYTNPGLYLQLARVAFLRQGRERPQVEWPRVEIEAETPVAVERRRGQSLGAILMRHKLSLLEEQLARLGQQQLPQEQEQELGGGQDTEAGFWDGQEYQEDQVSGFRVDEDGDVEMEDAWP